MRKNFLSLLLILLVSALASPIWADETGTDGPDREISAVEAADQEVTAPRADFEAAAVCTSKSQDATLETIARFEVGAQTEARGEACGGTFCSFGTYCCNPTCNTCVPYGWGCTQEVCN